MCLPAGVGEIGKQPGRAPAAGCIIEVNRSLTEKEKVGISGGLEATIKVPLVTEIKGKTGGSADTERTTEVSYDSLPINLGNISEILEIISKRFKGRFVVIEEFHYLPEQVQKTFALKLTSLSG